MSDSSSKKNSQKHLTHEEIYESLDEKQKERYHQILSGSTESLQKASGEYKAYEQKYVTQRKKGEALFMKVWQHPMYVPKGWGHELWIVNKEEYCGKLLFFKEGKKCSWHHHKLKDEVFYLQSGSLVVRYSEEDDIKTAKERIMKPGDAFHVYVGLRHQMEALEDSELFEFSTQHFDSDSYRIIKGD